MGRRSRKRSISEATNPVRAERIAATSRSAAPSPAESGGALRPRRLSSEERNEQLRSKLTPLKPGERPRPLIAAVAMATVFAAGNLVLWAIGFEVRGEKSELGQVAPFAALMFVAAWGMWTQRYWAVLGFQSLLAIIIVVFATLLMTASTVRGALLCVVVIGLGGWLFWSLVRVLGRMKVPRPGGFD